MANVMIPLFATSGDLALDYLADYWHEANARWFRGKMTPVPIVVMPPSNRRYPPLGRYADERIEIRRDLLGGLDQPDRYWNATGTVLHEMIHQYLCEHVDWRGVGHDDRFTAWCNKIGADLGLPEVVTRKPRGRKVPLSRYWPSCAKPAMQAGAA